MAKRRQTTPSLTELLRLALNEGLANFNTAMPGTVEKFDSVTGLADIRPGFKRLYRDDATPRDMPVIGSVPVIFPGTEKAFIKFPIKKGDTVLLVFAQRSIDQWLEKGGQVDPLFDGRFQLADAVAIPGLMPNTTPRKDAGSAFVEFTDDGKLKAQGASGEELLDLVDQLIGILVSLTVVDPVSGALPLTPSVIVALNLVKTKLGTIKG